MAGLEAAGEKALSGPDAIGRCQQKSRQELRCMVLKTLLTVGGRGERWTLGSAESSATLKAAMPRWIDNIEPELTPPGESRLWD